MEDFDMVKVDKTENVESEYIQCSSCLKSNEETKIFKLIIGKNLRQTTTIKLCEDCLRDLREDIEELGMAR
jgi:hypothetical protein